MITPRPILRVFWALHRAVHRVSGGRLGTSEPSRGRMGTLFLHTTGRTSGQPRVNPLFYLLDGPNIVVIASNGGGEADPAWWLNVQARPAAEVEIHGTRRPVRGRAATDEEDARLWPRIVEADGQYAEYRRRTRRPIPMIILEPIGPG